MLSGVKYSEAVQGFREVFGGDPTVVARAPGRVNLIGEHTDYNDGWVMPLAIDFATWTAGRIRADRVLRAHAGDRGEVVEISLDAPGKGLSGHWSDYVRGMAAELENEGWRLRGTDLWFGGDVPDGAGLSSSAALEISIGWALLALAGIPVDPVRLAKAGQRAEHRWAGTRCGIMDQFASANCRPGHALMLDCRSLEVRHHPLPEGLEIVVCDTGVKHALAGGEYNVRRAQCEEGVTLLQRVLPGIRALRDVSPAEFQRHAAVLPEVVRRRCRHVVGENARVEAFADALTRRDRQELGRLMAASHASLRDDYEVSCVELDAMVEAAQGLEGWVGGRMTGGGFGGCTVNLVVAGAVPGFIESMKRRYQERTGRTARVFRTTAAAGAGLQRG